MSFHIRDALSSPQNTDAKFITSAFDSCIPHLATIGSATQWGTVPMSSARPGFLTRHVTAIADAEKYRLTGSGSPVRVLIAEAVLPSGEYIPVGAMTLRGGYFPQYVLDRENLREITSRALAGEEGEFMFLEILVTDFSEATKEYRKGAGAALVRYAREWVEEELGMGVFYVECWAGNEGKLVRFYETQGFQKVDGFVAPKPNGEMWPGMFLRMDLGKKDSQAAPMPEVCGWTHNGGQAFIYMELVQGYTLEKQWDNLDPTGRVDICEQLSTLIAELRKLRHAPGEFFLGHINREPLGDIVFTNENRPPAGPFNSVAEFHDWLSWAMKLPIQHHWPGKEISEIPDPYRSGMPDDAEVVFTHADLHPSNIIISKDAGSPKVLAIIDWRQSGWYPDYWECCKAMYTAEVHGEWMNVYIPMFSKEPSCLGTWDDYARAFGY